MRRFLNNLLRDFRSTRLARPARPAPRRAAPRVESLEDRLVLTSATQVGSTLFINSIGQNHSIAIQSNGNRQMQIFDNGTLVNPKNLFNIGSITAVNIQVAGNDNVFIQDSNGMPFNQGATITLLGSGANNTLFLQGSRAISGNETYVAGGASFTPGKVFVDNLTFVLNNAITSVNDRFQITGLFDVQTSGTNVVLSGSNGSTQTLSGMGFGGGDTLTYTNKNNVQLDEYAVNANILLTATAPDALEHAFTVQLHGNGDTATIAQTPSAVFTEVRADIAPVANQASISLYANAGQVAVTGTSSTQLIVGQPLGNGAFSTTGIRANVAAIGVGLLFLSNDHHSATAAPENVRVTESTLSGTGLFGNNAVTLFYNSVGQVTLLSGQDTDQYTVTGSHLGAKFTSRIFLGDDSTQFFRADVVVDPGSHLNLQLFNSTPQVAAELDIHATNASVGLPGTLNGTVNVTFPGIPNSLSQIAYTGFDLVFAQG